MNAINPDARRQYSVETLLEFGTAYFNPMICDNEGESFGKIELVMQMVHGVIESDADIEDIQPGLAIVIQMAWAAAQHMSRRADDCAIEGGAS